MWSIYFFNIFILGSQPFLFSSIFVRIIFHSYTALRCYSSLNKEHVWRHEGITLSKELVLTIMQWDKKDIDLAGFIKELGCYLEIYHVKLWESPPEFNNSN